MADITMNNGPVAEFEFVERARRWLQGAQAFSRALEETLVDVIAAYTPWLAPLIPAAIGYGNVRKGLEFDPWLALVYALVVEFLGLATVTTTLQFRAWNQEQAEKAPFWLAIGTALFYLLVTLTVNVFLDGGTIVQKVVKGLVSTFSVAGAITLAMRAEQAKRVAELAAKDAKAADEQSEAEERAWKHKTEEAEQRRKFQLEKLKLATQVSEKTAQVAESSVKVSAYPETFGKWRRWPEVPDEQRRRIATMTFDQVMEQFGVEERTAYHWIEYAQKWVKEQA
jgi:hypothetical protein